MKSKMNSETKQTENYDCKLIIDYKEEKNNELAWICIDQSENRNEICTTC